MYPLPPQVNTALALLNQAGFEAFVVGGAVRDLLRDKDASVVAVLAAVNGDKLTFLAVCGKDAVAKGVRAGDLVKQVCTCCGGSGGGKPDSAMGGGKDINKMDDALATVDDFVASKLK